MIGQQQLLSRVRQMVENQTLPRFIILTGERGSGRKTFAKEIVSIVNEWRVSSDKVMFCILPDVKIDTIRETIKQAYKNATTVFYLIPDADNMSPAAKNALLKVTEEPPNESYFIMTLEDEHNTLETIRSRGTVLRMDRYTPSEIASYFYEKYHANNGIEEQWVVEQVCGTPGEVDILVKNNIMEFHDYVGLVFDNIAEVSTANSFRIAGKVALKDDAEGYDLRLFWKMFIARCVSAGRVNGVYITSKYLRQLRIKGINRQMLMDAWIMEIRDLWT